MKLLAAGNGDFGELIGAGIAGHFIFHFLILTTDRDRHDRAGNDCLLGRESQNDANSA